MSDDTYVIEFALENVSQTVAFSMATEKLPLVIAKGQKGDKGDISRGYEHVQSEASSNWIVTHDLTRYPLGAQLVTDEGEVVYADIQYPDTSTVVVTFATPQTGILRLT